MSRSSVESKMVASSPCARAFEQEADFVHRLLQRYGVLAGDVDDVVQEVFTIMWRRRSDFDCQRPIRPWLAGIAIRLAYKHRERGLREVPTSDRDLDHSLRETTDERLEARALLTGGLQRVSETNRTALMLHELDGLSVPQVAEALAIPLATAYARINRGRQAFVSAVRDLQADRPRSALVIAPVALLELGRAGDLVPGPLRWHQPGWGRLPRAAWPIAATGVAIALVVTLAVQRRGATPTLAPGPARTSLPVPATGDQRVELARGLVGYWRFDEGAGTIARDHSGHGYHCQLRYQSGEPWTERGSLHFTARGRASCPQPDQPAQGPADLTIALWMRTPVLQGYEQTLVSRQLAGNHQRYFLLAVLRDTLVLDSSVWKVRLEHPLPDPTRWTHVAFTHARAGATRLYLDGREVAAAMAEPGPNEDLAGTLVLGLSWNPKIEGWSKAFRGDLDDLVTYERVLSGAEIGALAARRQPSP